MGLLNSINDWISSRYERKIEQMENLGLCPECNGKGFHTFNAYDFYYTKPYNCVGCNGTGSFTEWFESNQ